MTQHTPKLPPHPAVTVSCPNGKPIYHNATLLGALAAADWLARVVEEHTGANRSDKLTRANLVQHYRGVRDAAIAAKGE